MENINNKHENCSENCNKICYICLDDIKSNIKPYNCNHNVHIECSKKWKNECPVCKSEKKSSIQIEFRDNNYFYKIEKTNGYDMTLNKYISKWDKTKCNNVEEIHKIKFIKNCGIIGICSCKSIQLFSLLG